MRQTPRYSDRLQIQAIILALLMIGGASQPAFADGEDWIPLNEDQMPDPGPDPGMNENLVEHMNDSLNFTPTESDAFQSEDSPGAEQPEVLNDTLADSSDTSIESVASDPLTQVKAMFPENSYCTIDNVSWQIRAFIPMNDTDDLLMRVYNFNGYDPTDPVTFNYETVIPRTNITHEGSTNTYTMTLDSTSSLVVDPADAPTLEEVLNEPDVPSDADVPSEAPDASNDTVAALPDEEAVIPAHVSEEVDPGEDIAVDPVDDNYLTSGWAVAAALDDLSDSDLRSRQLKRKRKIS